MSFKLLALATLLPLPGAGIAQTLYDFGNPTAEEQSYIELINRARMDPSGEGTRLSGTSDPNVLAAYTQYGVDLAMLQTEFNAIPAQPPLAPNAQLTAAARGHSQWMLANALQTHTQTNPTKTLVNRLTDAGYPYSAAGENIYAYGKSVWHGHAGFEVDWGTGSNGSSGGMQDPRGHRTNTHHSTFREIGVGVVLGSNGGVGPQLVTQDLGRQSSSPSFGTGVAYYDLNGNNFYDIGEGISGLTVNVSGASSYCTTAAGGGWVVPVSSTAATRTVTFSGLNVNQNTDLVFPASKNAKADLKLSYSPPAFLSPATASAGSPHTLNFAATGGATGYIWTRSTVAAAPPENCDSTAGITTSTTGSYQVQSTTVKQQGTGSFHLINATGTSQWLQLGPLYQGGTSPSLTFQSRVRLSTTSEQFKVQVKEEDSQVWQDVYSQTGFNGNGETTFNLRSAALTAMAGKSFRVRFLLQFTSGSRYSGTGDNIGWFIDAVAFSGVTTLADTVTTSLSGTGGSFTPAAGTYLLTVKPVISGREYPPSYQTLTVSEPPAATFATWAAEIETANSLPAGTLANPNGDHDKDGRTNLIEYAFGASPVIANDPAPRMPALQATATHIVLQYQRDTALGDLTFTAQACADLANWKSPGESGAPAGFTDALISTSGNIQTREAKIPRSSGADQFLRMRVLRP